MKSLKLSIYFQILILIFITSSVTTGISVLSALRDIDSHLVENAHNISQRTAKSLAFPFWNIDSTGVSEILYAQIQNANMHAILLEEESGANTQFVRGIQKDGDSFVTIDSDSTPSSSYSFTSSIEFEGESLGKVTIILSDTVLRSLLLRNELTQFILEMIVILFLTFPLTYFIANSFISPVKKLASSFSEVVDHNFQIPVASVPEREIQKISVIFESVRCTILETFEGIKNKEKDVTSVLNSLSDGIISMNNEHEITRLNPMTEKYTGWSSQDAVGKMVDTVLEVSNVDSGGVIEDILQLFSKEKKSSNSSVQVRLKNKSDEVSRIVELQLSSLIDDSGNSTGTVLVLRDITENVRIQEELKQKRKMESLGQLSGGVAHDFNNMLGGIIGFAELLNDAAEEDSDAKEFSGYILDAAESAADLTAKLLAFSRKGKFVSTPFSIHKSCETAVSILSRSIDKNISITSEYLASNEFVSGDQSQIQNALLNLCINAKDAMPNGGELHIATNIANVKKDNSFNLEAATYIEITVSDTGMGIPKHIQDKIFEPFFTTKEQGKGTGLGLAAVYGAVLNHNGTVTLESTVGEGTKFTVYLPIVEGAAEVKVETSNSDEATLNKNILVVDDERIIRTVLDHIITGIGGTVMLASDGVEAVALFREKHSTIDLVILDMVMPNMTGDECFHQLVDIDAEIPVILASGFDKNSKISGLLDAGALGYLHKPFITAELINLVRRFAR